jgi:hypothetical protein
MAHTEPRYTKDLDVWVEPTPQNAEVVYDALRRFGAPVSELTPGDFAEPPIFFQIGVPPVRIDILTTVSGLEFSDAWHRRMDTDFDGVNAPVLSREDLIVTKRAAGRPQDHRHRGPSNCAVGRR